jgi:SAM-dependent methyltransferase
MRQVAQETARGQRSQPYVQRRPLGGSSGPRPQGPRGPRFAQGAPAVRPGPRPGPMGPRPDRQRGDRPPHGARKPYRTGVQSAGDGPPRPSPAPEEPALGRIRALLSGYQPTAAILAAYSLGIFTELHRQSQTRDDLARTTGVNPRGLDALLDALVSVGVVHRHGPTLVLPRDYAPYLVPGTDGDATGMIDMAAELSQAWTDLARGLKEGTPRYRLSSEALLAGDAERVRTYIRAVHTSSREAARRLAEMAPLLPGSSLLDIGGGSGIFAAELARRTPDLKAFVFDLPPTLEIARSILRAEGLEDTVEYAPGDYRLDPFPGPVDAILISNVLQTESEENALMILRKASEALRPGGTLLVHGAMAEASGAPLAPIALFSLLMYILFDDGRAWSAEKIAEWLAQERFGVRAIRPLGPPFHSKLIVATRLE